jgi:uncharacterized protein YqgC (DUF456 family)
MDTALMIIGGILVIIGILGSILPILPGPPISYVALILLQLTSKHPFSTAFLVIFGVITALVVVIDYLIPVWGTKRFGGSKAGMLGGTIGVVAGLFIFPPFGIIIGPFIGAIIGELIAGREIKAATRAGFGSLVGFLTGTVMKIALTAVMAFYFFKNIF